MLSVFELERGAIRTVTDTRRPSWPTSNTATAQPTGMNSPCSCDGPPPRRFCTNLIATYPKSNRAGCALVELARGSNGEARERYLKEAIASHGDAWFENGVQVGAIARALLSTHYAGQDRWDEAERLARELSDDYAGSIDESGWPLDDVLTGVRLLRSKK